LSLPLTEALEELIALGVEGPALIAAMRRLEEATYSKPIATMKEAAEEAARIADERKAKASERTRKWREKNCAETSEAVTSPYITESHGDASTLSPPLSPQTPQTPPPIRECITTREREDRAFGRFWADYPRKTAKADARKAYGKAWRKLPPNEAEALIVGGLERAKAAWSDAQFIPHAATWLNGERWNDEPPEITPRKPHERPHHDAKLAARQANLAAHERGADLAARFHGEP
jgi:hypothetical protein